jgi:hypothetical protein
MADRIFLQENQKRQLGMVEQSPAFTRPESVSTPCFK